MMNRTRNEIIRETISHATPLLLRGNFLGAWELIDPCVGNLSASNNALSSFGGQAAWGGSQEQVVTQLCTFYVDLYSKALDRGAEGFEEKYLVSGALYDRILSLYRNQKEIDAPLFLLIFQLELEHGTSPQILRTQMQQLFRKIGKIEAHQDAHFQLVEFYVLQVLGPKESKGKIRKELNGIYGGDSNRAENLLSIVMPPKSKHKDHESRNGTNSKKTKKEKYAEKHPKVQKQNHREITEEREDPKVQEHKQGEKTDEPQEEESLTETQKAWDLDFHHYIDRSVYLNLLQRLNNWRQSLKLGSAVLCLIIVLVSLRRRISMSSARRIVLALVKQIAETFKMAFTISYV